MGVFLISILLILIVLYNSGTGNCWSVSSHGLTYSFWVVILYDKIFVIMGSSFNSFMPWHLYMRSAWPTSPQGVTIIILHWYRLKDESKGRVEESHQIEKLVLVLPDAGPILPCLMTTMRWSFLLNLKEGCFIFINLMMNNVKSFHVSSWKLISWIWIFR